MTEAQNTSNKRKQCTTSQQSSQLKTSYAQKAPVILDKTTIKVSKLDGIKSMFMLTFPAHGEVYSFSHSQSIVPTKTFKMQAMSYPNSLTVVIPNNDTYMMVL